MREFRVGDRVRYTRGARWQVRDREGLVLRVHEVHHHTMLDVDFVTEVYPCWEANVDLVEAADEEGAIDVDFEEVSTAPTRRK